MATTTAPEHGATTRRRKEPPEKKIGPFQSGVGVCIWTNVVQTEQGTKTFRSLTLNARRFFDRDSNQWKDSLSYNPSDLPSLIYALQLAEKYCYETHPLEGESPAATDVASGSSEELTF